MPRPDDRTRLLHIVAAAEKAMWFARGKGPDDLDADEMLSLALVRLLEIVGEAASTISDECRSRHPKVPWPRMAAMRNRLIHGYFDIDYRLVWQTVTTELPPLLEQAREALTAEGGSSSPK